MTRTTRAPTRLPIHTAPEGYTREGEQQFRQVVDDRVAEMERASDGLQSSVVTLQADVDALEVDVAALEADVAALETDVAALDVMTTRGDMVRRGASAVERFALGTSGYALISDGTDPVWTGFVQAGTGATTRTWQAKVRERITPLDFGAVGDGSTDDTAAVALAGAAANAAGVHLDGAGLTYRLTGDGIQGTDVPYKLRNIVFDISDVTTPVSSSDLTNGYTTGFALQGGDLFGGGYAKATTSGTIENGNTTITVDDSSIFAVGDRVLLHSTEGWSNGGTTKRSEGHFIKRIVSSTVIQFEGEIEGYYNTGATAATVRKYPAVDLDWENVRIRGEAETSATVTITIATPGVITWTGHGLSAGMVVEFSTTGTLPTGLTAGTNYYVIATGLATDTFQVSASLGGAAVNTSVGQSGTHSARAYWPQSGVAIFQCRNVRMHNITVENCHHTGLLVAQCFELTGGQLNITGSNRNGYGYGLNCVGVNSVNITAIQGNLCRHVVTSGGGPSTNSSGNCINRRIAIGNLVGYGCTDAVFDAHPGVKHCAIDNILMTGSQFYHSSGDGFLWQGSNLQIGKANLHGFRRHGLVVECFDDGDQEDVVVQIGQLIAHGDQEAGNNYGLIVTTGNCTATKFRVVHVGSLDVDTDTGVLITAPATDIEKVTIGGGHVRSIDGTTLRILNSASARTVFANLLNLTCESTSTAASVYAIDFTGVSGKQISRGRMVGCDTIGGDYGIRVEEATLDLISHTNSGSGSGASITGTNGTINTYA